MYDMIHIEGRGCMHSLFLREVSIDWDAVSDYTQHIAALHSFDRLIFQKQITFFTGENGSGKSTQISKLKEYLEESGYDVILSRGWYQKLPLLYKGYAFLPARGDSFKPRFLSALLFLFFTGGKFL